jgi:hypothetical protein
MLVNILQPFIPGQLESVRRGGFLHIKKVLSRKGFLSAARRM